MSTWTTPRRSATGAGAAAPYARWRKRRLAVVELLNAGFVWEGGPSSPSWPLVRPPLARLARITRHLDENDGPSPRPIDPAHRVEWLLAAQAAVDACGQLNGPGRQREVAHAAAVVNTALFKIAKTEFRPDWHWRLGAMATSHAHQRGRRSALP